MIKPNEVDAFGYTALHFACLNGHSKVVEVLLAFHANPSVLSMTNLTPLHCACYNGYRQVVKILIKAGGDADFNPINITPLMIASYRGFVGIVCELVESGMELEPNPLQKTRLWWKRVGMDPIKNLSNTAYDDDYADVRTALELKHVAENEDREDCRGLCATLSSYELERLGSFPDKDSVDIYFYVKKHLKFIIHLGRDIEISRAEAFIKYLMISQSLVYKAELESLIPKEFPIRCFEAQGLVMNVIRCMVLMILNGERNQKAKMAAYVSEAADFVSLLLNYSNANDL